MKYISIIFSLIFTLTVFGQNEVDEKAQAILKKVSENYESFKTIKADFDMTFDFPETDDDEMQTGTIFLEGDAYKLNLEGGQTIITDNKTLWTFLEEVNEVQISYYEPDETAITPSQIFNIYEQDFYFVYNGKEKMDGKTFESIDLTPNDKDLPYFKIRILVSSDNVISKATVFDKNANKYIYKIKNFESNVKLKKNFFSFNTKDYSNVEVIDLR